MSNNKYRAWDKDSKIMIYSDYINKREYFCDYIFKETPNGIECLWSQEIEDSCGNPIYTSGKLNKVDIYTGYKDRNGAEIFEGDIISYDNKEITIKVDEKYSESDQWNFLKQKKDVEIIGNIYYQ